MTQTESLPSQGNARSSNVPLPATHWRWIDQKHTDIANSWPAIRKNTILRALVTIAMESDADLTGCIDETDLTNRLRQAIKQHDGVAHAPQRQEKPVQSTDLERRSKLLQAVVNTIMVADLADT